MPVGSCNSLASLRHFVQSGLGITLMSSLSIGLDLVGRRLAAALLNAAEIHLLVAQRGRTRSPAITELLQVLRAKSVAWEI